MNYIAEIKAFYDALEINPQPNTAIALWHALMSIANKAGWPDTFTVASSVLGLRSGLSASAFKRARNKLATDGFIEWKSRGGNQSAQYKLNSLVVYNGLQSVPQTELQSELQSVPQTEPQSGPINKQRHKHKLKDIPPISPAEALKDFLAVYPCSGNYHLTEIAFMDCLLTKQVTEQQLIDAAKNYADACRIKKITPKYMKHPENFLRDLEYCQYLPGVYMEPEKPKDHSPSKGFNDFQQNNYDFENLEGKLLAN